MMRFFFAICLTIVPIRLLGQTALSDLSLLMIEKFQRVIQNPHIDDALTITKEAERFFMGMTSLDTNEKLLIKITIGELYVKENAADEAFRVMESIRQETITDSVLLNRSVVLSSYIGLSQFVRGNYRKSEECFDYAIRNINNCEDAWNIMNRIFQIHSMCLNKNKNAIDKLQELVQVLAEIQSNTLRGEQPVEYADGMRNAMNKTLLPILSLVSSSFHDDIESRVLCFNLFQFLHRFSLIQINNRLEDIKHNLRLDYKTIISNKLKADEIAISIEPSMDIIGHKIRAYNYVAYILNHKGSLDVVQIANKKEIEALLEKDSIWNLYSDKDSSLRELVWSKMEPYTVGKKKIYITPCGMLNRINFVLFDNRIHELSSLFELVQTYPSIAYPNAILIGGLNYEDTPNLVRGDRNWGNLTNTKKEIDSIAHYLSQSYSVRKITNEYANKDTIQELCKDPISILHFSTHGFCYTDSVERGRLPLYRSPLFDFAEKQELTFSGLVLSGGNRALEGRDSHDGSILLGEDIRRLNLINTQLVVLSACESGLGVYDDVEGSLGLITSFKIAGAKNIVASLFEVNDDAACEFMIRFYRQYMSTGDIHSSFLHAVYYMKSEYPDNPKLWSMFKLVQ